MELLHVVVAAQYNAGRAPLTEEADTVGWEELRPGAPRAIHEELSMKQTMFAIVALVALVWSSFAAAADAAVTVVVKPPTDRTNSFYVSNKPPLEPSAFVKLPIGAIVPKGWLRHQLDLEAKGLVGRLTEVSPWCKHEGNAWLSAKGEGHSPWEELPYWLKGFGDLGYVLGDQRIIAEANVWLDAILARQEPDGWFGPAANKTRIDGTPDCWPNMPVLNALQSFYEYTKDSRVLPFMTRYFQWQLRLPRDNFLRPFWQYIRAGDNLESVYWLYNRTNESWLLELGKKIHERTAPWTETIPTWHGVNISQGFRQPAVYFLQAKDAAFVRAAERNYDTVMDKYGQVPGGMFGADENCREGYYGPRQGAETCTMVEFMHSFQMLMKITGNPLWADRCEEVAFDSYPAARPPDLKGLHYLTAPNMIKLDRANKSPALEDGGCMLAYDPFSYRCCQHNISHGWPYYAEELWLATPDNGLCASLYAASEVTAKVGDGTEVTITESTDYPFDETISLKIATPKPVAFPLYLRIPRWCEKARVAVIGEVGDVMTEPLRFAVISRSWANGDTVELALPADGVEVRWWKKNDAMSVHRGPLTYSLKIGEKWIKYGGTDEWPAYEVFPTTPWNYGLAFKEAGPSRPFEVVKKPGPLPDQPFTPDAAPIEIRTKARKIPQWKEDEFGLVGNLQKSPALSHEPLETVTLIPMGCARIRIAAFPTVGTGGDGVEWGMPPEPPLASHANPSDTVLALNDGVLPKSSGDTTIPRFTWWDHRGTTEWVAYRWEKPRTVSSCEVYWFDDTGRGQCRVPKSWRLLARDGDSWKPVSNPSAYGTRLDAFNKVAFDPVTTTELRLEAALQGEFSGGILEWRVGER
jgi:hypothetical protein